VIVDSRRVVLEAAAAGFDSQPYADSLGSLRGQERFDGCDGVGLVGSFPGGSNSVLMHVEPLSVRPTLYGFRLRSIRRT
jgi:hypothetical protein